jgi:hypothetical protein
MSVFQYRSGLGSSAAYQVSAIPFLKKQTTGLSPGSTYEFTFPQVTKFIKIVSLSSRPLLVGFSSLGISSSNNYFTVAGNSESAIYYWRVSSVFIKIDNTSGSGSGSIEIHAGLTTVSDLELTNNWSGSVGVG